MRARLCCHIHPHLIATRQPAGSVQKHSIQRIAAHARKQRLQRTLLPQIGNHRLRPAPFRSQSQRALRTRASWHSVACVDVYGVGNGMASGVWFSFSKLPKNNAKAH